tara:strand:+ start:971 stop:2329 length:1359 start_codon:yes stop_codon:yes gene_type:complete
MDKKEKGSHAQGDNPVEKQASQLAYDVKYKVKAAMNKGTKMNPAQVAKAYLSQLAKSPAAPAVKAMAKKKLMGEEYTQDIGNLVQGAVVNAIVDVFTEATEGKKYKIRVTDKKTGNTYIRNADRAKIAELRANPNISSVEITSHGEVSGDGEKKAKKDYDGDGKVESGAKEYRGAVHNAIQKKKGGKADGQDTSSVDEGVIYEKDEKKAKITGKNVDNYNSKDPAVKVFPKLGEQKEEDPSAKAAEKRATTAKKMVLMKKLQALRSGAGADIQASAEMEGSVVEEDCGNCSNCDGKGCTICEKKDKVDDLRSKAAEMKLLKNKMRARGIRVAGEDPTPRNMKTYDDLGEAKNGGDNDPCWDTHKQVGMKKKGGKMVPNCVPKEEVVKEEESDRLKDQRMERGGVDGNTNYRKAPKFTSGPKKKYDGMSALEYVKADIRKKHGKGAIMDTKKK